MRDLFIVLGHVLTPIAKLLRPGGRRAVVAESVLLKQQLLVVNRARRRAPNLYRLVRFLFGFWSLLLGERRIPRVASESDRPDEFSGTTRKKRTLRRRRGGFLPGPEPGAQ